MIAYTISVVWVLINAENDRHAIGGTGSVNHR